MNANLEIVCDVFMHFFFFFTKIKSLFLKLIVENFRYLGQKDLTSPLPDFRSMDALEIMHVNMVA